MSNISESVFQAIDTIVKKRLSELSFDQTIVCEIVDDTNAAIGKYRVKQGITYFDAYNEDITFSIGEKVNVLIPQNDYNQKKIILNRHVDNEESIDDEYIPTKDNLYFCSDNLYKGNKTINLPDNIYYDTIYIEAKCGLSLTDSVAENQTIKIIKGDYGSKLNIYYNDNNLKEENLNCDQMIGDTYYLHKNNEDLFLQTFIISVNDLVNIKKIVFNNYNTTYEGYINDVLQTIPNNYINTYFDIINVQLCQNLKKYLYDSAIWAYNESDKFNFFWYQLRDGIYKGFENNKQIKEYEEKKYYKELQVYKELYKINDNIFIPQKQPPRYDKLINYYQYAEYLKSLSQYLTYVNKTLRTFFLSMALVEKKEKYKNTEETFTDIYNDCLSYISLCLEDLKEGETYIYEKFNEYTNIIENLNKYIKKLQYIITKLRGDISNLLIDEFFYTIDIFDDDLTTLNTAYNEFLAKNENQYDFYLFFSNDNTVLNNETTWQEFLEDKNKYYIHYTYNSLQKYNIENNDNKQYGPTIITIPTDHRNEKMGIVIIYNHQPYFSNTIKIM